MPSSAAVVRLATSADAAAITRVMCDARETFLAYAPLTHTRQEVHVWLAGVLIPGGGVHVATIDDVVVGMMAISTAQGTSWIDQMYVHPRHVGAGVGTKLLQRAQALMTPPFRLYTFQANTRARRFYERHGFQAKTFSDGAENQERCPDVLYERAVR